MAVMQRIKELAAGRTVGTKAGAADPQSATWWTTPWQYRDADGLYIGWNDEAWLYTEIATLPLAWEDPQTQVGAGGPLLRIFAELESMTVDNSMGMTMFATQREFHIVSVTWDEPVKPPVGTPERLAAFQADMFTFHAPKRALFVGVKLRSDTVAALRAHGSSGKTFLHQLRTAGTKLLGEGVPDRRNFAADRTAVDSILMRNGGKRPSKEALRQLESWFNNGRGPDALIRVSDTELVIRDFTRYEMSAVAGFSVPVMHSPDGQWALEATAHPTPPAVISVRGQIQPAAVARTRARRAQRRIRNQMEEEQATGDLERLEDTDAFAQAQQTEQYIASGREPILSSVSIVFAHRVSGGHEETYADALNQTFGIEVRPLVLRQLEALDETLPCSSRRVNPFLQDLSLSMISHCGIQGWSNLGDSKGAYIGLSDPDMTPVFLDPLAAPAANQPPAMAIFGDPGSGKTYLGQMLATQATLAGYQTIFINPKGFSTLAPFAELVDGQVVRMSQLELGAGGFFDPFRFAEPAMAAEIATQYILTVLGNTGVAGMGFTASQELKLGAGLRRGADAGARCVVDALAYVEDPEVLRMVEDQRKASTLFSLGVAAEPGSNYQARRGLTLIEFDRKLDFPERGKATSEYSRSERISLAVMRLVTRASMEILAGSGGGVLVVDEAWTFLGSSEGLSALQTIGREGRSQNLLPIFITQRVADLVKEGIDMEAYLSRIMVMNLTDPNDAAVALRLCGLKPTEERIAWLTDAAPKPAEGASPGRPSMGIHRDLSGRHAAIYVGPSPDYAHAAFTTNPAERQAQEAAKAARLGT